jgi:hypothetical protein
MKSNTQHKVPPQTPHAPYRTLEGWALGKLIESHAVTECSNHGHRRDKADPEAWNHARDRGTSQHQFLGRRNELSRSWKWTVGKGKTVSVGVCATRLDAIRQAQTFIDAVVDWAA